MFEQYGDIMGVPEIAEALFIGRNQAYKLLEEGELKAFRLGRTWKIPKKKLEEYVLHKADGYYTKGKNTNGKSKPKEK